MANDLITELDRLHHRASDLRARERQLADAGENDPATDAWKIASILAASAESEFEGALVKSWPAFAALLREAGEGWLPIESAPANGREILLANESIAFDGWWDNDLAAWVDGDTDDYGNLVEYQPTHWRPLPAPPATGGKDAVA